MSHCGHEHDVHYPPEPDCCARDRAKQVRAEAVVARLKAVDCSMAQVNLASEVLGSIPGDPVQDAERQQLGNTEEEAG